MSNLFEDVHTVVDACDDGDNYIYVLDKNGSRTGEVVGTTVNPWDFLSASDDGQFGDPITGIILDFESMRSGDAIIDDYSSEWRDSWFNGAPRLALESRNGGKYDIKANEDISPQGSYTPVLYNGSRGFSSKEALPEITTTRALGNILFGINMKHLYGKSDFLFARDFYEVYMPIVGAYNQRNYDIPFNLGYPFYGEHTYSGTYIHGGFFGRYR
jgi:hypothetical protein